MAAPDYQNEGSGWIVRGVSLAIAGAFIYTLWLNGNPRAIRLFHLPFLPLAVIWYPEMAASLCRAKISTKTAMRLGWAGLAGLTIPTFYFCSLP